MLVPQQQLGGLPMQPMQQQPQGLMQMPPQQPPMSMQQQPMQMGMPVQQQPMQQPMQQQQQQQQPLGPGSGGVAGALGGNDAQTQALLRQVQTMTDEQINLLPQQFRDQVMFVKQQIAMGVVKVE
jgi:hypothetical protein